MTIGGKISFVFLCLAVTSLDATFVYGEAEAKDAQESTVSALRTMMASGTRSECIADVVRALEAAAATRRFDAALLIIDALKYNYNPAASNERRSQVELIPAIGILRRYYGVEVCPMLVFRGIATTDAVVRERCALAVRTIASQQDIEKYVKAFSLEQTTDPGARKFRDLLAMKVLEVHIGGEGDASIEKIDNVIHKMKQKAIGNTNP